MGSLFLLLFPNFFKKNKCIYLFIYGCVGSSLLRTGFLFIAVCGLLIVVASLVAEHGALGACASVVVARGLSSCGLQALEHRLSSCGAQA